MSVLPPGSSPEYPFGPPSQAMQELKKGVEKVLEGQRHLATDALGKYGASSDQAKHVIDSLFREKEGEIRSLATKAGLHPNEVNAYVELVRDDWRQGCLASARLDPVLKGALGAQASVNNLAGAPSELIALVEAFKNAKDPLEKDAVFQQIQGALGRAGGEETTPSGTNEG